VSAIDAQGKTAMKTRFHRASADRRGFTLAEMMVVIVIIGLLATLVVPNILQRFSFAQSRKAQVDITSIESALTEYSVANGGKWPDSLEALVTPDVNGHTYIKGTHIPKDPWGNEYMYDPPETGRPDPRVYTYGKDGQAGGEGDDADIDNLTIREEK
jgi:general secretion pathway protein G